MTEGRGGAEIGALQRLVVNPTSQLIEVGRLFGDATWQHYARLEPFAVNGIPVNGAQQATQEDGRVGSPRANRPNSDPGSSVISMAPESIIGWLRAGIRSSWAKGPASDQADHSGSAEIQTGIPPGLKPMPITLVRHLEEPATTGDWRRARMTNPALRIPDEVLAGSMAGKGDDPLGWLTGLNWHEASTLARFSGGRLPNVKELEHLIASGFLPIDERLPPRITIWSSSSHSNFAFSLRAYHQPSGQWREPATPYDPAFSSTAAKSILVWDSRSQISVTLRGLSPGQHGDANSPMFAFIIFDISEPQS